LKERTIKNIGEHQLLIHETPKALQLAKHLAIVLKETCRYVLQPLRLAGNPEKPGLPRATRPGCTAPTK
jgi:hypothetical protein